MQSDTGCNCIPKQTLENRRLLQRIFVDMLIIVVSIIPILVCEFAIQPFRRGFYCDDDTIRYPFKGDTVTPGLLALIVGLPCVTVLAIGEFTRQYQEGQLGNTRQIFGYKVAIWITKCLQQFVFLIFGLLLTLNVIEVGKYTVGHLRPHFMAVCQPELADGTTCNDLTNQHRYVENYSCLATGFTEKDVRQTRLSFPSTHSSLAFYGFIYISLYLQKRMHWRRSDLTRPFIQFIFIMMAWLVALSRIRDNWHHWSDVLAGCLIGVTSALINANFISKFFRTSHTDLDSSKLKGLAREDTSVTLNEVLATAPPPYMINQHSINDTTN